MKEIINKPWNYKLLENNKKYYLSVMCGSVALFEINIELNNDELLMYHELGNSYIDSLVQKIQFNSSLYLDRNISNLDNVL